MECEVCGRPVFGPGFHIVIDGAELLVCKACSTLTSSPPKPKSSSAPSLTRAPASGAKLSPPPARRASAQLTMPEGRELAEGYGQVIRRAREALQLSQEELSRKMAEKVSVLQKLESERLVPDEALVRKLEHALKIKLVQQPSEVPVVEEKFRRHVELTLGDIAVMQKKRGEGEAAKGRKS